jgi:TfoX/Sxy family transcriptional regulator of competence genes
VLKLNEKGVFQEDILFSPTPGNNLLLRWFSAFLDHFKRKGEAGYYWKKRGKNLKNAGKNEV